MPDDQADDDEGEADVHDELEEEGFDAAGSLLAERRCPLHGVPEKVIILLLEILNKE